MPVRLDLRRQQQLCRLTRADLALVGLALPRNDVELLTGDLSGQREDGCGADQPEAQTFSHPVKHCDVPQKVKFYGLLERAGF